MNIRTSDQVREPQTDYRECYLWFCLLTCTADWLFPSQHDSILKTFCSSKFYEFKHLITKIESCSI